MAGVRTLITCFGLPHNITNVKEFNIDYIGTTQSLAPINDSGSITWNEKRNCSSPFTKWVYSS